MGALPGQSWAPTARAPPALRHSELTGDKVSKPSDTYGNRRITKEQKQWGGRCEGSPPHEAPPATIHPTHPMRPAREPREGRAPALQELGGKRVNGWRTTAGAVTPGGQDGREASRRGTGMQLTPPEPTAAENENGHTKRGTARGRPARGRGRDVPDAEVCCPWTALRAPCGGTGGRAWERRHASVLEGWPGRAHTGWDPAPPRPHTPSRVPQGSSSPDPQRGRGLLLRAPTPGPPRHPTHLVSPTHSLTWVWWPRGVITIPKGQVMTRSMVLSECPASQRGVTWQRPVSWILPEALAPRQPWPLHPTPASAGHGAHPTPPPYLPLPPLPLPGEARAEVGAQTSGFCILEQDPH